MTSDLVVRAKREQEIVSSPEAQALQQAIFKAVRAYSDFLERHDGLIWGREGDDGLPTMMAQALVITADYGTDSARCDITLKDGALDQLYGEGADPDPGLLQDDTPAGKH